MIQEENFLKQVCELLSLQEIVDINTRFESLEEYDSLSQMTIRAWLEEAFSIKVSIQKVDDFKTFLDLYIFINTHGTNL